MKTAVLVIDVQEGLCEGAHATFESQRVIDRINEVSAKARAAGAPVIFVQHESPSGDFAFESTTWQLAGRLNVAATDLRLRKTTCDSFHRTALRELLNARGITDLVVCGMQTEFCVDTTVRRALALGYPIALVADAHTTENSRHLSAAQIIQHHNDTLANIESFGPRVRAIAAEALRLE
jgi:nicotinamidase-related amidase